MQHWACLGLGSAWVTLDISPLPITGPPLQPAPPRMNLYNTLWQESYPLFFWTCFTCGLGAILLFGGVMAVIVKRKLMFITSSI